MCLRCGFTKLRQASSCKAIIGERGRKILICDAHADTLYRLATEPDAATDVTLEHLRQGGVSLQVLALFVGIENREEVIREQMNRMLSAFETLKQAGFVQADDPKESKDGQLRIMLSLEGCEPLEPGLKTIQDFRALGVRMAAITWNYENKLGTPACKNNTEGLKPYGFQAVREMQRLGIAADVSHLNIAGFYDILNKTDRPPLASHSCCRALCEHTRNLTDQQLRDLFSAGGYVGVNFYPAFLVPSGIRCDIDSVINHMDHMHQLGGAGMVGFGSDFDGISSKPEGLETPADFPKLIEGLRKRGYSEQDIKSIAGLGFIRYFERLSA